MVHSSTSPKKTVTWQENGPDQESRSQRITRSQSPTKKASESASNASSITFRPIRSQSQPVFESKSQSLQEGLSHVPISINRRKRTTRSRSPEKPTTPFKVLKINPETSIYRKPEEPMPTPRRVAFFGKDSPEAVSRSAKSISIAVSAPEEVYSPNIEWTDDDQRRLGGQADEDKGEEGSIGDFTEVVESDSLGSQNADDELEYRRDDNDGSFDELNSELDNFRHQWKADLAGQAQASILPSRSSPQAAKRAISESSLFQVSVVDELEDSLAEGSSGSQTQEARTRLSIEEFREAMEVADESGRAANSRRGVSATPRVAAYKPHGVSTGSSGVNVTSRSKVNIDTGSLTKAQANNLDRVFASITDAETLFEARFVSKELVTAADAAGTLNQHTNTTRRQKSTSGSRPSVAPDPFHAGKTLGTAFSPGRFVYPQHPLGEHSNSWYLRYIHQLYKKVIECGATHFGQRDIIFVPGRADGSYWVDAKPTPELESYVAMVAEPDPANGGWDRLLAEKTQRGYLVAGVIAKVLEVKVFGALFFGADEEQLAFLEELERKFINHEGYERTALRASTVRTLLSSNATPPRFHSSVLSLTHQLFALLLPFDLGQSRRQPPNTPIHAFAPDKCMQDLHDIVGMAAYLSIAIRLSKSVMLIRGDVPGEKYDEEGQDNVDHGLYLSSKEGVERMLDERATAMQNRGEDVPDKEAYTPRIKIAIWPSFKRFSAGNGQPGGESTGFRVYDVSQSRVVYYWGVDNRKNKGFAEFKAFMADAKSAGGWLNRLSFGYLG